MQYTTTTPLSLDHVLDVIGKDRFVENFHLPISEWGLTEHECARLKAGPHGQIGVYLVDSEYMGMPFSEIIVQCECGAQFADRLLSGAQRQHDEHTGYVAQSHVHTADILEG